MYKGCKFLKILQYVLLFLKADLVKGPAWSYAVGYVECEENVAVQVFVVKKKWA